MVVKIYQYNMLKHNNKYFYELFYAAKLDFAEIAI